MQYLQSIGFTNSVVDTSLFIYNKSDFTVYLLVYEDDVIIIGNNDDFLEHIVNDMANRFFIKDFGYLSYFMGMEVILCSTGLILT